MFGSIFDIVRSVRIGTPILLLCSCSESNMKLLIILPLFAWLAQALVVSTLPSTEGDRANLFPPSLHSDLPHIKGGIVPTLPERADKRDFIPSEACVRLLCCWFSYLVLPIQLIGYHPDHLPDQMPFRLWFSMGLARGGAPPEHVYLLQLVRYPIPLATSPISNLFSRCGAVCIQEGACFDRHANQMSESGQMMDWMKKNGWTDLIGGSSPNGSPPSNRL